MLKVLESLVQRVDRVLALSSQRRPLRDEVAGVDQWPAEEEEAVGVPGLYSVSGGEAAKQWAKRMRSLRLIAEAQVSSPLQWLPPAVTRRLQDRGAFNRKAMQMNWEMGSWEAMQGTGEVGMHH